MHLDHEFIVKTLKNVQIYNGSFPIDSSFSVDTRSLKKGDIFVALSGQKVDGHDFIQHALDKGASGFLLSLSQKDIILKEFNDALVGKQLLFVQDTLQALVELARNWRSQFSYPVVAITGSVGKTTTKEMVRNILKQTDKNYLVSFGNQNTLVGVSLNILKMRADHQVAVFEVGIGVIGAMKELAELLRPTYALITKVGHGHMQGLGDIHSVAKEKREVFACFSDQDIGMINGDQDELVRVSYNHPTVRFGYKTTNQIQARKIAISNNTISFTAKIYHQKYAVLIPGSHEGRVLNALAAMTIGYMLHIPNELLIKGVEQPVSVMGRFQTLPHPSGSVIINDSYNSNPDSLKASLLAFDAYQTDKKKILVLGDMMELGIDTTFWHRQLGRLVRKVVGVQEVVLIGKHVEHAKKTLPLGLKATWFSNTDQAYEFVKALVEEKEHIVLFKASRSLLFPELIDRLFKL